MPLSNEMIESLNNHPRPSSFRFSECDSIELLEQYIKTNPDSKFAGFALDRIDSLRLRKAEIRCQELARKELEKAQEPKTEPEPGQTEQQTEQEQQ